MLKAREKFDELSGMEARITEMQKYLRNNELVPQLT